MEKERLFVDMDGTLAEFKPVDHLEKLYEPHYFERLKPIPNVVNAIRFIAKWCDIEIYIMSSVLSDSKTALSEKNYWLDKYLPEIDSRHRIFPPCDANKSAWVPDSFTEKDYLLDDYTKNLRSWCPPGQGIKLLNGLNHTRGSWEGNRLACTKPASELANDLIAIIKGREVIRDSPVSAVAAGRQLTEQAVQPEDPFPDLEQ